jgi:hypothetical protein
MRAAAFLILLFGSAVLPAQGRLTSWTRQQWDGPTLYTWSVSGGVVEAQSPGRKGPETRKLTLPQGHRLLSVVEGEAWTVHLEGPDRRPALHRSRDGKAWERLGQVPLPEARIRGCFPLRGDRFLLHQGMVQFMKDGQASNLAIFRLKDGVFLLEELVDPGLNFFEPMPPGQDPAAWIPRYHPRLQEVGMEVAMGFLEVVGGHPVVMMASLGKVAVFSPEHGHLLKVVTLYGGVDDLMKGPVPPLGSILLARPLPTGLLVAARSEDAMRTARAIFPDAPPPEPVLGEPPAPDPAWAKRQEAFPEVLWFTWDLSESSFRAAAAPEGFPEKVRAAADLPALEFVVDLQGRPRPVGPAATPRPPAPPTAKVASR